jgi:opacity protein-like surface antigen
VTKIESVHSACRCGRFRRLYFLVLMAAVISVAAQTRAQAAKESSYYTRKNTFGVFVAYSWDSSHILLGNAENRKLLDLGASYSFRLLHNHVVNWQYNAELIPVVLESDPVQYTTATISYTNPPLTISTTAAEPTVQACHPSSGSGILSGGGTFSYTSTCGRRWTVGEGMSPIGFQWNFSPLHRVQPFLDGHGGYMYSTQAIPVEVAGSFNFTFDFGAGIEVYRTRHRSIRAEYRYHHFSNDNTAQENPGVDNGLLQVSYCFGR